MSFSPMDMLVLAAIFIGGPLLGIILLTFLIVYGYRAIKRLIRGPTPEDIALERDPEKWPDESDPPQPE